MSQSLGLEAPRGRAGAGVEGTTEASTTGEAGAATEPTTAGPLAAMAAGATAPSPTASEVAYVDGPGVKALEALFADGMPKPEAVVDVIDAHRGETGAIFSWLEERHGATFVQQVRDEMGLRVSIDRREVVAGDPTSTDGGYFLGSAAEQGARWRTSGGRFSGTAGRTGVDATYRIDEDDAVHAKVDQRGTGTVAWERDGKTAAELYRTDSELGLRRDWDLGSGGALQTGVRRRDATDEIFGTHRTADDRTTTTGRIGLHDGQVAGALGVTHTASERDRMAAELMHDARGTGLSASATRGLASGATLSGSGSVLHAPDGTTTGALSGAYEDTRGKYDASVTRGADATALHLGARRELSPAWSFTGTADLAFRDQGNTASLAASATRTLGEGSSITGRGTLQNGPGGTTGSLGATYIDPRRQIDGSITRGTDQTALHLGAREQLSPEWSLTGSLDHVDKDRGRDQTTLRLAEQYRSGRVVHGLGVEAGRGERDYLAATGSVDAQLGDRLYGGAFGSYRREEGKHDGAQLGASLTFTPNEKAALTLAGVLDERGTLETRLQLDVFKSRLKGVGDLADHKRDALVSLFVSYTTAGRHDALDSRFGEQRFGTAEDKRVMAGIRIKF